MKFLNFAEITAFGRQKVCDCKGKGFKEFEKYGKRRIKSELYSKGIDAEYVEEAVSYLDEDEEDMLLPLVEKKGLKVTLKRKTLINVYDILCTEVTAFLTLKIV